jgi:two-component system, LytTR family, sensor kinase
MNIFKEFYSTKKLILLILISGLLIFGIFMLSYGIKETDIAIRQVILSMINTAIIWIGCMTIVKYLWKKYPWEHHPAKHLIIEIIAIFIYTMTVGGIIYYLSVNYWELPIKDEEVMPSIITTLLITYLITGIHESVFFYQQWKYNFSKSIRLERDNIAARYEALRSQINPHFLFNSLNSLVSLVEENKTAVDYVRNLSDLLRYMLKSSEKELVLLRDELVVLHNYTALQQLRFGENLKIVIDVSQSSYHYALPPLVMQMLVENAIKHNIITRDKPLSVSVWTEKDSIFVQNNLQKKDVPDSTGQGLKNIAGRYRHLTGRSIRIEEGDGRFKVGIPLLTVEL